MMGLKGEGIANDTTWITRTTHTRLLESSNSFTSYKTFVCVRNPLDVFPSYAFLFNTCNHATKPQWQWEIDYPEWWDWWIRSQALHIREHFGKMMKIYREEGKNPIYFVRYEDLVQNKRETLMGLFSFLLETKDIKNTNCERRIDSVLK